MYWEQAKKKTEELLKIFDDPEYINYMLWTLDEAKELRTNLNNYNKIRLEGKKFGYLTVLEEVAPTYSPNGTLKRTWLCKCKCGNLKEIKQDNLKENRMCSCGCLTKAESIIGEKFGYLTVVEKTESIRDSSGHMRSCYRCICDCGKEIIATRHEITGGKKTSCGCAAKVAAIIRAEEKKRKRLKNIWRGMCKRCTNPKDKHFKWYGERGINLCEEWEGKEGCERFIQWAIENGYKNTLTIDRIDNDKGYSPDNCRWIDHKTQQRNKSTNTLIEYNGQTKCIGEWAEILNINYNTFCNRLSRGWSVERAIETPVKRSPVKKVKT